MGSSSERDLLPDPVAGVVTPDRPAEARAARQDDTLEIVVYDELGPCPYLTGQVARMPLRIPLRRLSRAEFDRRLEAGNRRQGRLLYRTQCPACDACEPIRVLTREFVPGRTQRRVLRRGQRAFQVELGPPETTRERVALYNRHKHGRGLMREDGALGVAGYEAFLVDTCCETFEMRYRIGGKLAGVAVVDRGERSLSAVYTYFDPSHAHLSPGVFSILMQIELCKRWNLPHLYLGLYVEECSRMVYKGRYLPHERLIGGEWRRFDVVADRGR
jgi:arginine-tRNA-protein transferase